MGRVRPVPNRLPVAPGPVYQVTTAPTPVTPTAVRVVFLLLQMGLAAAVMPVMPEAGLTDMAE